ncbi:MAG: NADH-quinone oxidoreductase subunit C [Lachnospiraceae bacterium]|nr:NADH-quinone oxidoreductase subunit C [Lachnospiraceae bacterium]
MDIKIPENELEMIEGSDLLKRVLELKKSGFRFSQANAALIDGNFELSYSFSDYETYGLHTLRIVTDTEQEIPSITQIVPAAVFYENEMKELYGVKIKMIDLDYRDKLYRIRQTAPMGKQKTEE